MPKDTRIKREITVDYGLEVTRILYLIFRGVHYCYSHFSATFTARDNFRDTSDFIKYSAIVIFGYSSSGDMILVGNKVFFDTIPLRISHENIHLLGSSRIQKINSRIG